MPANLDSIPIATTYARKPPAAPVRCKTASLSEYPGKGAVYCNWLSLVFAALLTLLGSVVPVMGANPITYYGRRLTGWQLEAGSIHKVPVDWKFDALYENGVRCVKARHPSISAETPYVYSRTSSEG